MPINIDALKVKAGCLPHCSVTATEEGNMAYVTHNADSYAVDTSKVYMRSGREIGWVDLVISKVSEPHRRASQRKRAAAYLLGETDTV